MSQEDGNAGAEPLRVTDLIKSYPGLVAVRGWSFSVETGRVLAMVGPNGAGKTTTMRCIAGILRPSGGEITVAGMSVLREAVGAKRRQAYVPDDPKLFDTLTVWEHLDFLASAYELRDWEGRAEQWMTRFELLDKRDKACSELSRGMRQKTALVGALMRSPALLMLDEPMTGLDPMGIRTMKDAIRELAGAGAGVVISSHLLALVEDLCDGVLIVHKGQQVFFGDLHEARARYTGGQAGASLEDVFFRATAEDQSPGRSLADASGSGA